MITYLLTRYHSRTYGTTLDDTWPLMVGEIMLEAFLIIMYVAGAQ